jgi:hypothetical protein
MRKRLALLVTATAAMTALLAPPANASHTVVVTGNGNGWTFNPDPNNATDHDFNFEEQSIGNGALEVQPISSTAAHKFIALHTLGTAVADLTSISYDFMIAGNGAASDASDFYINVYTNLPGSDTYYDCRFDYVATSGSTTDWTTQTALATDTPSLVASRGGATCPTTLAAMVQGSSVSAFTINVGDTSANDAGLGGYLDNVVVTSAAHGATTYDFDVALDEKDDCKDGGWASYGFANQGDCVSSLEANANAGK